MHTPQDVHTGAAIARQEARAAVLRVAYDRRPDRFVHHVPRPPALPTEAWINKPPEHLSSAGAH
jgi:putative transposase